MKSKLTITLEKQTSEKAKAYAKSHQVSLSKLIENYLLSLSGETKKKAIVSPLVESLTGIIQCDYDEKQDYRNYIDKKSSGI